MWEVEQRALEYVRRYVRYGFYTLTEVEQIVGEDVFDGAVPRPRLRELVEMEAARHRAERQSWPEVTDCDRLDTVFDSLTNGGILALQNAGCTLSEGRDDVAEAYREAGGKQSGITGFCFYHRQDLEGVLESGELYLAFGAISGEATEGVGVGQRVAVTLAAAGFAVESGGRFEERIKVKGIRWQRG